MSKIQYLVWMLLMVLTATGAKAQNGGGNAGGGGNGGNAPKAPTASGTVLKVAEGAFVVLDTQGAPITVPVTSATAYLMNKTPATPQEILRPGMKVKATAAPDGSAAQVTASGMATSLNINQLQAFLAAADDEWAILKPRIDRIKALKSELSGNGGGGNNGGNNGNTPAAPPALSPMEAAGQNLSTVAFADAPAPSVLAALKNQRDIRAKITTELTAEKTALIRLLTPRQEALLVAVGILD